jgi:glycine hydroxymethyltransferase
MGWLGKLKQADPEVAEIIFSELKRQKEGLELIPSENYVSESVLEAMGTILTNKYSEGQPFKRYYGGNEWIDAVENLAVERAKKLFGVAHVNVQPYSGSPANLAVYMATCNPGDTIMGHGLTDGGHLTHGFNMSATGIFYKGIPYHVRENGYLDMEEFRKLAHEHKPKLIWCGASAYSREIPFEEFSEVADEIDAYLAADIAHIAGLICGGVHTSPVPYVHIVTTTTHKTLRGPRGAMIMVTEKGLQKDPELAKKIDKCVFPGLQGGPHDSTTAAIAAALGEASKPEFKEYAKQVVKNSQTLAENLMKGKLKIVTNGTDNHLMVVNLTPFGIGMGIFAEKALDLAGITLNKNTIPKEPSSPFYPSGIRLGSPAITSRGMKEEEMKIIAKCIVKIVNEIKSYKLPENKDERSSYAQKSVDEMKNNQTIKNVREEIMQLCKKFPLYEGLE